MSWWKPKPKPEPKEPEAPTPPANHYDEKLLTDVLSTLDEETKKLDKQRFELEVVLRRNNQEVARKRVEIEFNL